MTEQQAIEAAEAAWRALYQFTSFHDAMNRQVRLGTRSVVIATMAKAIRERVWLEPSKQA